MAHAAGAISMTEDSVASELLVDKDGDVAVLTLNRPDRMNKLTDEILRLLGRAVLDLEDDGQTRAIILKGSGGVFSPGFDLGQIASGKERQSRAEYTDHSDLASDTFWRMWRSPLPIVASVNKYCLGGAVYLTGVCDFVVTTPSTQIGMSELKLGIAPPLFNIFPWLLNNRNAREFLFLGDVVDGERAVEWGLASRCVPEDDLEKETHRLAKQLAAMPHDVVARMKRTVRRRWELAGIVAGIEENLADFVDNKLNMGEIQSNYGQYLREGDGKNAMERVGVDIGVRGLKDPWC